jgi:hypothetical protein
MALTLLKCPAITGRLHQASQAWASPPKETSAAASNSKIHTSHAQSSTPVYSFLYIDQPPCMLCANVLVLEEQS